MPIEFEVGDLVQVYNPTLDMMHKAERKIAPRWSGPRIVVSKGINSYKLARLNGNILERNSTRITCEASWHILAQSWENS